MNKVFKVIWSEARNAYVVVSEIAKNHGSKSCSTKKLLTMLIATGVMTCASMAPAMADNPASDDANKGWNLSVNNGITAGTEVQPGGYVNFNGDEGNIIVSATKEFFGPSVQVKLSRDLNVDSIHAGEFFMNNDMGIGFGGDAYITQSGLNANGKVITNVAAGTKATDAVNVGQLNSAVAESGWKLATNGAVTDLKEIKNNAIVNFEGDENIGVSNETVDGINTVKVELNKDLKVNQVNAGDYFFDAERGVGFGGDAYITKNGLNANDKVITNVAEGVYNTDAVNVGQLKKVEEVAANANKGWNLSTNGVATKATNVAPGEIVDFSGDKNIKISNDGTNVKVKLNENIDVNYVQTNALNAKYNLSVGTANENGTVPFFVNSNGAFYGANGSFVVDKDGNVTAGNVVLNNGVHIGNSALRDGELFVGDASGNYSQITPKSAKLGQVTIDEKGNIAGVNSIQTNVLNAKYNLSVGTANENGTVPFFVNSNGAFYGANGSFVVDKDGNVTAGNVVLKNGVFTGHSALRDGELFVGDASGNYSQITTKGAKLGKVTVAADGKISGVAAGAVTADSTDAVNGSQLHAVATEAGKHSKVVSGNNINVEETDVDGQKFYKVNMNKDIMLGDLTGKNVSISGTNGTIEATGAIATKDRVYADKGAKLADIDVTGDTISNGDAKLALNGAAGTAGMINGKGASVYMQDGYTVINSKVAFDQNGKISGVAAGTADTDAVNVSQLKNSAWKLAANGVLTEAEDVKAGDYVDLNGDQNVSVSKDAKDGVNTVKVELNKDLKDIESISNGDAKMALNGAAGTAGMINGKGASVYMQDGYTVINSKVAFDQNGKISGVAAGTADTDAVNVSQLKAVGATANMGWNLATNGVATEATNVKPGDYVDFSGDKNISVNHDGTKVKVELNKDLVGIESISNGDAKMALNGAAGTAGMINGKGASVYMQDGYTVINSKVAFDQNGKISGVAAGAITADSTDAVNGSQLHAVATEAGKHSKVVNGSNINVEEFDNDGQKIYKVNLNKDIMLGDLTGKNVSISGTNGTIETTGYIATKDRVYADKGAKLADIDVTGDTISNGDAKLALNGAAGTAGMINGKGASVYMQDGYTVINSKVAFDQNGKISGVAAGAVTADSTDAVNGSQLHAVATEAGKHSKVVSGNNINVEETDVDGQKFYKVNMNKDIILGDLTGKYVNISGTNGTIEATGAIATNDRVYADKGAKLADIDVTGNKISNGASSIVLDGSNVKVNDKVTIDQNGKISGVAAGEVSKTSTDAINGSQLNQTNENVAALDKRVTQNEADIAQNKADIAQNKADIATNKADIATNKADIATNKANIAQNAADIKKVEELAKKHTTVAAGDNITVTEDTNKDGGKEYKVALDKDIKLDSVTTGQTVMNNDGLKVGDKVSVTATAVTAGKTSISDEGVKVGDKTYISADGLNANDQKVTNVKAGDISETSKDAVNGSQLYKTNQEVVNNTNRINKLGSRVNKVGAGAAALAALHPMDFDPDDKLTFSAGYGNYAGENAAAIGAYYRPDEKVMFSVAGTVGNGENMVNAGVSFALDRTNHVSNSRTALAREVIDLRGQLAVMGAKMAKMEKAFGMLDETKTKLFPDVPANHWAYEYIAKLAGNGYIEGYPDGNFGGDRLMTRYEFAAMLYRAIENGAALEEKIIKEFEPELGRIRVDRISGEDGDRDKIERVRVNDTKGERDHYGNKLAK